MDIYEYLAEAQKNKTITYTRNTEFNNWAKKLKKPVVSSYASALEPAQALSFGQFGLNNNWLSTNFTTAQLKDAEPTFRKYTDAELLRNLNISFYTKDPAFTPSEASYKKLFDSIGLQSPSAVAAFVAFGQPQVTKTYDPSTGQFLTFNYEEAAKTNPIFAAGKLDALRTMLNVPAYVRDDEFGLNKFVVQNLDDIQRDLNIDKYTLAIAYDRVSDRERRKPNSQYVGFGFGGTNNVHQFVGDVIKEALTFTGQWNSNVEKALKPFLDQAGPSIAARQSVFDQRNKRNNIGATLIGTILGTALGGPVGAFLGSSVGQLVDNGKIDVKKSLTAGATTYIASSLTAGAGAETAANIGKTVAPSTSTATQVAIGEAVINAGVGAGVYGAAGGDPIKGALVGAIGSIGSTTYATSVGEALGATGASATIIGNAVLNAGLSGIVAAVTGGDISKSMLAGALKGAAIVGAKDFAEAILGKETIASIAKTTGLDKKQVENIFTTSVANGVIAEITGQGDLLETFAVSLASQGIAAKARNIMEGAVEKALKDNPEIKQTVLTATSGIAETATSAALRGIDVGEALERSAPGIILSSVRSYQREADRQDAIAAEKEKELAALQQPIEVAGAATVQLTQGEIATQAAKTRGEEVVGTFTEDGVTTYQMTGVRDDGSRYYYKILDIPEVGIKYEFSQIPTDPITLRVLPGAQMGTQVRSEPPDFRGNATIGLPTTDIIQQLEEVERPTFDPIVIPQDVRQATTQNLIESELQRLENELSTINQRQKSFQGARGQFERLSDLPVGTIDEQLQRQLEDELVDLERQATEGQGRIPQIERERGAIEGIGTEGGRTLSDEQLLGYLETGEVPQGLLGGQPEGEGTAPEGGFTDGADGADGADGGAGGGGGDGGAGGGDGGGALEPTAITTPLSPALIFSQSLPARPETTPFASRVTGEALEGILGEKQPLFGGDDDEQRAVWNRRSLRLLSRALGI